MEINNEIAFSSFLAGVLLTRGSITYLEFSILEADFTNKYNVDYSENDFNYDKISNIFYIDKHGFHLKYNLNETVMVNKMIVNVYDYLYECTNQIVRDYFDIHEISNLTKPKHLHRIKRGN